MQIILTEEEYNEFKNNKDTYIYDLEKEFRERTRECQLLREENKELKARIEMYQITSGIDAIRNCGRPPKNPSKGGFNF